VSTKPIYGCEYGLYYGLTLTTGYWCDQEKKRIHEDITGLVRSNGCAVESKNKVWNGLK